MSGLRPLAGHEAKHCIRVHALGGTLTDVSVGRIHGQTNFLGLRRRARMRVHLIGLADGEVSVDSHDDLKDAVAIAFDLLGPAHFAAASKRNFREKGRLHGEGAAAEPSLLSTLTQEQVDALVNARAEAMMAPLTARVVRNVLRVAAEEEAWLHANLCAWRYIAGRLTEHEYWEGGALLEVVEEAERRQVKDDRRYGT